MTTNMAVFEKVAARQLTPSEAASQLLEADRLAETPIRPRWMPALVWPLALAVCTLVLGLFGFRKES
jgi:hypothetical protein